MDSDIYMDIITRDVRFGPKKGQIGTKWDKSGTFEDNFSVPICPNLISQRFQIVGILKIFTNNHTTTVKPQYNGPLI